MRWTILVVLLAVGALGCEPRPQVQTPFPGEAEVATEAPTAALDGPPTREQLVASVPGSVAALESRHEGLVTRILETEEALIALDDAIRAATTPEQHADLQGEAAALRAAAREMAGEAAALRDEARRLRETSRQLKALTGAEQPEPGAQ
jgi:hypothetical protein